MFRGKEVLTSMSSFAANTGLWFKVSEGDEVSACTSALPEFFPGL